MKTRLAIGYWSEGGNTFTLSRETTLDTPDEVNLMLSLEAQMDPSDIDTILLVESVSEESLIQTSSAPTVYEHWSAANGDFESDRDNDEIDLT